VSKNTADRRFESMRDAQIDLGSSAMVEAQHPVASKYSAHRHFLSLLMSVGDGTIVGTIQQTMHRS